MKKQQKRVFIIIAAACILYLGVFGSAPFINKYWFPKEIRKYIISNKYPQGECLRSTRWGVNPKKVIGYKEYKSHTNYLLQDQDRYEHYQQVSAFEVENYAVKTSCRI